MSSDSSSSVTDNEKVQKCLAALNGFLGRKVELLEHKPVMTSDEHFEALKGRLQGLLVKNLFLKDKKDKFYLLLIRHDRNLDMKVVTKLLKLPSGTLRFAPDPYQTLQVGQGSVTPLALVNDASHQIVLVLDRALDEASHVNVHPLSNIGTVALTPKELKDYVTSLGNPVQVMDFDSEAAPSQSEEKSAAPPAKGKKEKVEKVDKPEKESSGEGLGLGVTKNGANFANWYQQVVTKSEMISYYEISGCYILRPWSYEIWENIQRFFDNEIKLLGVKNAYFPMFIPKSNLEREKDHVEGFAPEVAWVTKSGDSDLNEPIAIRPTSETIMYPYYAKWIRSHRDLPLKLNQWTNVVRWEFKYPTPFIRTREFLWQEGHSAFATKPEADKEVRQILDLYERVYEELLAVPVTKGTKTETEKFAGGLYTTTVEAYIPIVGRGVQGATSHCLGQNFAKMFEIEFESKEKKKELVWQNSWGLTTRTIGVMIMVHGDDKGLVLPPRIAPTQVVIVPILFKKDGNDELILTRCAELSSALKSNSIRTELDDRDDKNPGFKFNHWELRGVPLRLEMGPKDYAKNIVTIVRRDTGEKKEFSTESIPQFIEAINKEIKTMQLDMLNKARAVQNAHRKQVQSWSELMNALENRCTVLAPHCRDKECEAAIKKRTAEESKNTEDSGDSEENNNNNGEKLEKLTGAAKSLCIPFEQPALVAGTKCINNICSNPAVHYTLFGRSY